MPCPVLYLGCSDDSSVSACVLQAHMLASVSRRVVKIIPKTNCLFQIDCCTAAHILVACASTPDIAGYAVNRNVHQRLQTLQHSKCWILAWTRAKPFGSFSPHCQMHVKQHTYTAQCWMANNLHITDFCTPTPGFGNSVYIQPFPESLH